MTLQYVGIPETYEVLVSAIKSNVIQVSGEDLPMKEKGFTLIDGENEYDYTAYNTLYRATAQGTYQYSNDGERYEEPTRDVLVEIAWDDADNAAGLRPNSVKVTVADGSQLVGTVTLKDENDWQKVYPNVPVSHIYTVSSADIDNYNKEIDDTLITYDLIRPYEPTAQEQIDDLMAVIAELEERIRELEEK